MAIRKSSNSGIPFGNSSGRPANPSAGQPYFNGEEKRLELYTSTGWQNIVSETPGVVSVSGNYPESIGSATLEITGTNFTAGAIASVIGTNGVEINASSTTVNSIVSISAVFAGLSNDNEPYDIKVTNTSNLFGLLPDSLYINASPVWQTASGSLGTFAEQISMSVSATATDESAITYSLASGSSLPSGITLNSSSGLISGTLPDVSTNTTYTFTINASDGSNTSIPRTFSFVSNAAPVWVTSAESLGSFLNNTTITTQALSVTDSDSISYALASGSTLPAGLILSSSTGIISGTLPSVTQNTTYTFTINATDGLNTIPRTFSITSVYDISLEYLIVAGGGGTGWDVGGGGGGGGVLSGTSTKAKGTTFAISVGGGGVSHPANTSNSKGDNGGNSSVFGLTAIGGGGGGSYNQNGNGRVGGSGGGGGGASESGGAGQGAAGTSGQGYAGGNDSGGSYGSGGGGGAGGPGATGIVGQSVDGGLPIYSSITGTSTAYSGGGYGNSDSGTVYATGTNRNGTVVGYYGFGANGTGPSGVQANPGVVIIAYPNTMPAITTIPGTLTYDQPTRAGYRVYRFTAGSGTITF
jgi:hypothetical protein